MPVRVTGAHAAGSTPPPLSKRPRPQPGDQISHPATACAPGPAHAPCPAPSPAPAWSRPRPGRPRAGPSCAPARGGLAPGHAAPDLDLHPQHAGRQGSSGARGWCVHTANECTCVPACCWTPDRGGACACVGAHIGKPTLPHIRSPEVHPPPPLPPPTPPPKPVLVAHLLGCPAAPHPDPGCRPPCRRHPHPPPPPPAPHHPPPPPGAAAWKLPCPAPQRRAAGAHGRARPPGSPSDQARTRRRLSPWVGLPTTHSSPP